MNLENVDKSNIIMFGPTGSGKTLIARTLASILDVPFSMNDATPFTQAGYVGEDVDICVSRLLQNANYDVTRAEKGIIFIDEIDKIARRSDTTNPNQRDVSGEGVQQGLLRILEGTPITVSVKAGTVINTGGGLKKTVTQNENFTVDTTNVLFICSGAFVGLDKIVKDRLGFKGSIGFGAILGETTTTTTAITPNSNNKNILDQLESQDLIKYGFIPEFIGRLPVTANANILKVQDLIKILTTPKNSLVKQYIEIFKVSGLKLKFHELALEKIAEKALASNTGARGLRRIMESILEDPLYEYPGTDVKAVLVLAGDELSFKIQSFKENQLDLFC